MTAAILTRRPQGPMNKLSYRDGGPRVATAAKTMRNHESTAAAEGNSHHSHHAAPLPHALPADPHQVGGDGDDKKFRHHHHGRDFTLRYHIKRIFKQSPRLINFFVHGTPIWLFKFVRLVAFVVVLLPAFLVFAWYYATTDRVSVPYKVGEDATSRHFVDIYGSMTDAPSSQTQTSSGGGDNKRSNNGGEEAKSSKKPVVIFLTGGAWIIGYKMWGALLARALVPFGVLVAIPDYRNFPAVTVGDMVCDVDESIQWILDNAREFNGDPDRVVVVGQSAGGHLGSCVLLIKALSELRGSKNAPSELSTTYQASDIRGFIPASGPYDLVAMRETFHQHGLDRNIVSAMFGHKIERYSPIHLLAECRRSVPAKDAGGGALGEILPPICVIHGTADKTAPFEGATEFASRLREAKVDATSLMYEGWSHTDPILEAPMRGDHRFHRDVYNLVQQWTTTHKGSSSSGCTEMKMVPFDESVPTCRRICPNFLIALGRFFNPF